METVDPTRLHASRILVVDDIELNRELILQSLKQAGFHNIHLAADGSEALRLTRELRPDLVILDLMMPSMDGFAYCEAVREDEAFKHMPIIVQTALDDIEQKMRAFRLGASDYICKPLDPGELIARTKVHLNQKILMLDLFQFQQAMKAELRSARQMQLRLMPSESFTTMCERVYDMDIASHFQTSSELGGDGWGMRPITDNKIAIWVFDFSGHGVTAAMNVFRMHTIMQECVALSADPGQYLTQLNRRLREFLETDQFATMFYAVVDTEANSLQYVSAAAPAALLCSTQEPVPVPLQSRGLPLGVVATTQYETRYAPFSEGDMVILHSDCLLEASNEEGKGLDEAEFHRHIAGRMMQPHTHPAKDMLKAVLEIFSGHHCGPLSDDLTLSLFYRNRRAGIRKP